MKKTLLFFSTLLTFIQFSFSQSISVSEPVTPYVSHLVPAPPPVQSDTIIIKPNFIKRGLPLITHTEPLPHYPDLVWQQDAPSVNRVATVTETFNVTGIGYQPLSPPDPSGEAGSNYYIQSINGSGGSIYKIYNKTTGAAVTGNVQMDTQLGGSGGAGDPIVIFDEQADRWVLTEFSASGNKLIVHVSQTNNPQGAYWTYEYTCPTFPDYPKYAVWPNAYIVTTNESSPTVYALPRATMLTGTGGSFIRATASSLAGFGFQTLTPMDLDGDSLPPANMMPLVLRHRDDEAHNPGSNNPAQDYIEIFQFNINWTTPASSSLSLLQTIAVTEFDSDLCGLTSFNCIKQPTTNTTLDPLREPIMNKITYRNFGTHQAMVMCLTTDVNGNNLAGIRWIELRRTGTGSWSKYQEGTYAPNDGISRWMGSIGMDKFGNIALGFSLSQKTSPNKNPSLRYTGRKPCDPLGTMTVAETEFATGNYYSTSNRWGDYHQMSVDPSDDATFFFTGEYIPTSGSSQWGTKIVSFRFNPDANEVQPLSGFTQGTICGSTGTLGVVFINNGTNPVTSLTFSYTINAGPVNNQAYTGNLTTGNTDTMFLNLTGLVTGTNTIHIITNNPNGNSDDNTCNDTLNVIVNSSGGSITVNTTVAQQISCFGGSNGSITATPSGGSSPYSYVWTPSGGTSATTTNRPAGTYTVTVTDNNGCTGTATRTLTTPTQVTATISSQTNILCYGTSTGAATVTAGGGSPGYTYNWSPSGGTAATTTNRPAGTYTVTVTDNSGCTKTATVNITQPTQLTASITSSTNISCNGGSNGSATVTASGGTSGYTYSWSPSGGTSATTTNRPQGTYTVTVTDANNCTKTATVTLTQPTALTATITGTTNPSCGTNNGSITVAAAGGTSGYTYSWSPSGGSGATASGLASGTYTVTITDANSCTKTATASITQVNTITANISTSTNATCGNSNGSATVSVSGGTPGYTYNWSPSGGSGATATSLGAGTYTVTVTDAASCTKTATVIIINTNGPSATISSSTNVSCFGGNNGSATVSPSGGSPGYSYNWSPAGGTGITATSLTAGTYTVTITDQNTCTVTSTITITQPTALNATITGTTSASCGSNNGTATVSANGGTGGYTYNWSPGGGSSATATGLTAGTYTVTVTDANSCTKTATATVNSNNGPSVSTNVLSNATCFGNANGSGSATVTGGTPGYTYSWSPGGGTGSTVSALTAGTYTVLVTDQNLCTGTATLTITQPPVLTVSITSSNATCGQTNGSATASVNGGTPGYSYSWSSGGSNNTESGLSSGTYTVTVTDANGCTQSATTMINNANGPSSTISSFTNVTCFGGSNGTATVTPSGGTPGYTYNWSPSGGTSATGTGLSAGAYVVTVTDANACTSTSMVTITSPTALTVNAVPQNISCAGSSDGQITISAGGGSPGYQYSIDGTNYTSSGIFSNLAPGNYTVYVRDQNNCVSTTTTSISAVSAITVSSVSTTDASGANDGSITITANGGTPPYQYSLDGTSYQTGNFFGSLAAGNYTVYIRDNRGCVITITITINPNTTGIEESESTFLSVYPNPNTGQFTVHMNGLTEKLIEFKLYNTLGQQVYGETFEVTGSELLKNFKVKRIAAGTYYLVIDDYVQKPKVTKLIIGGH